MAREIAKVRKKVVLAIHFSHGGSRLLTWRLPLVDLHTACKSIFLYSTIKKLDKIILYEKK